MDNLFPGFKKVPFMTALEMWNRLHVEVRCVYRQSLTTFGADLEWRSDFKVHGGMILEGDWYVSEIKLNLEYK